jgi:metallo-beta-lactamase family protein
VEESRHIAAADGPKIIIAGSGMSAGGRILGHEKEVLDDKNSTLCIVGYQSVGSIGRRLLDGEKTLEIMGERVPVRAHIEHIFSYSAHKDSGELIDFAAQGADRLEKIFVVMGEPAASTYLAQRLRDYAGLNAMVPKEGESIDIDV